MSIEDTYLEIEKAAVHELLSRPYLDRAILLQEMLNSVICHLRNYDSADCGDVTTQTFETLKLMGLAGNSFLATHVGLGLIAQWIRTGWATRGA